VTRRWETLDVVPTSEGPLELRRRGAREFLITLRGRVLMNSEANRSEVALGRLGCQGLATASAPRILIGGLGMACTLRACLDVLPESAEVLVAELNDTVAMWCRDGPLAELTQHAACDPRVRLHVGDVYALLDAPERLCSGRFDAVLLDLYDGPPPDCPRDHPQYGVAALARARAALVERGVLAVWSEDPSPGFETCLGLAGFQVRRERPGRGGRRHVVYVARARGSEDRRPRSR
jgi:spermidine synthase